MKTRNTQITLFIFAGLCFLQCHSALVNTDVKRTIDVSKHIVKTRSEISFIDDSNDIAEYKFVIPESTDKHVAYMNAVMNKASLDIKKESNTARKGYVSYNIKFKNKVSKGTEESIKIFLQYTHILKPFPEEIKQGDDQLVLYEDNYVFSSPYKTKTQTTKIKLPSSSTESYSEHKPVSKKGSTITYGPYADIKPFSSNEKSLRVHFTNNSPFLTLTSIVKEIEVSMWGRVSIESVYELLHSGAKLIGGFSRYDYMHNVKGASFYEMETTIPKDAVNVYYRDQIGNITTSRLRTQRTNKLLEFKPRFPIFGGWKTQWYMGYSVPTHTVLHRSGNKFRLTVDFSTSIEDAVVDDLTVKVILPEGSSNVKVKIPFSVNSEETTKRLTYLDTAMFGRPVLIIRKDNLTKKHNQEFDVTFEFDSKFMFLEPALLISSFFTLFLICMVLFRLDISLKTGNKDLKQKTE